MNPEAVGPTALALPPLASRTVRVALECALMAHLIKGGCPLISFRAQPDHFNVRTDDDLGENQVNLKTNAPHEIHTR